MVARAADLSSVVLSTRPKPEDALQSARGLVQVLDELAAGVPRSEGYELRLAEALAGGLVDQLEAIVDRRTRIRLAGGSPS
jgi:hypothetical protein